MYADTAILKHPFVTNLLIFDVLTRAGVSMSTGMAGTGVMVVHGVVGWVPGVMGVRHRVAPCGTPPGTLSGY